VAFLAAFASGCGTSESEPTENAPQGSDCGGRGEPIVLGMEKPTQGGIYRVRLVEASPLPPLVGDNEWTVDVATSAGEPVIDELEGDESPVILNLEMVGHQHRLRKAGVMTTAGVFEFPPVPITMTDYWEFTIYVAPEGFADAGVVEGAIFGFCVPPN
jgi:hypothetical protein